MSSPLPSLYTDRHVLMFDFYGTLFQPNQDRDIRNYYRDILTAPTWNPLEFPDSMKELVVFPDVPEGLDTLRDMGYTIVSCTNFPVHLQMELCERNVIRMDFYTPLELHRCYKPDHHAYIMVMDLLRVPAKNCHMITANRTFGDLEAARELGMNAVLIRDPRSEYHDLVHLANGLECVD